MVRRYGWALRSERLVTAAPHGHWRTTTFVAGLRSTGLVAPLVLDGPMNGPAFLAYVEQFLAPTGGEVLRTFTILTCAANATMRQLHERMPVMLGPDAWLVWLGKDAEPAWNLMRLAGDGVLHLWPVSRAVNSVRNNGAELLDRVNDPDAPPPSDAPAGANPI